MKSDMVLKLNDLFKDKGWLENKELLIRFTNALSKLDEHHQELILSITKQYTYISSDKYEKILMEILEEANNRNMFRDKMYVVPLIKYTGKFEREMKQVKSSNYVAYLFKSTILKTRPWINGKNINVYNFLLEEDINKINTKGNLVIFIDDYIGSGRTAFECIDNYMEQGLKSENILIISLYIEKVAQDRFYSKKIDFLTSNIPMKNINNIIDSNQILELEKISKKLGNKDEPLGYAGTGGLVSMVRTPNNTIPFYWVDKKGRIAPFPR